MLKTFDKDNSSNYQNWSCEFHVLMGDTWVSLTEYMKPGWNLWSTGCEAAVLVVKSRNMLHHYNNMSGAAHSESDNYHTPKYGCSILYGSQVLRSAWVKKMLLRTCTQTSSAWILNYLFAAVVFRRIQIKALTRRNKSLYHTSWQSITRKFVHHQHMSRSLKPKKRTCSAFISHAQR
jgi:hypothetical protein